MFFVARGQVAKRGGVLWFEVSQKVLGVVRMIFSILTDWFIPLLRSSAVRSHMRP